MRGPPALADWGGIDALHPERVVAEFPLDKADEQAVDIPTNRRGGVDNARTPSRVREVRRVEPHLGLAVQALRAPQRQEQRRLDLLERHVRRERIAVQFLGHVSSPALKGLYNKTFAIRGGTDAHDHK